MLDNNHNQRLEAIENKVDNVIASVEALTTTLDMFTVGGYDQKTNTRTKGFIERVDIIEFKQNECIEKHKEDAKVNKVKTFEWKKVLATAILSAVCMGAVTLIITGCI